MNDEERYEGVLHALYDAVLERDGWREPLLRIAHAATADNAHLMVWNPDLPMPLYSLAWGMAEPMEKDYRAHYGAIDPRRLLASSMREGQWFACHHHFGQRTVARSEFFQDYLIPGGSRYLLGTRLVRHGGLDVYFGIHRAPRRPAFDEADLLFTRRITGHFQRAARLWLGAEALREQADLGAQALDAIELGILALSAGSRVVFANRYGEALLRAGAPLGLRRGVLAASDHGDAKQLQADLQSCRATGQVRCLRVGHRAAVQTGACSLTLLRLARTSPLAALCGSAELLVLVSHGNHRRLLTAQQLMQLFDLTPAEARLARALAAGEPLDAYAAGNGLRLSTVKTQLRAVFDKTGTQRQAELVRHLAVVPAARQDRHDG